jgi:hypothetical protein
VASINGVTLQTGTQVSIKAHVASGINATIDLNWGAAKAIKKDDWTGTVAWDLKLNGVYTLVYDGTDFYSTDKLASQVWVGSLTNITGNTVYQATKNTLVVATTRIFAWANTYFIATASILFWPTSSPTTELSSSDNWALWNSWAGWRSACVTWIIPAGNYYKVAWSGNTVDRTCYSISL